MSAQRLLDAHGIRLTLDGPDQYHSNCPECSPKRKSKHQKLKVLGVLFKPDGKVIWHCNHCGWSGPPKGSNGAKPGLPTHVYRDYAGIARFRKVRHRPGCEPRFWLEQPDGSGGWKKGVKGVDTTILYRVDEIRKAIDAGHIICVVEGEKDADNLWKLGIPATCNAHGAATPQQRPKWHSSHSAQLKGAKIVVLNDNDSSGYAHADTVCKLSLGVAKDVRRLDLRLHWPEMPEGKDVSDWLALGGAHTTEKLSDLIRTAPDYTRNCETNGTTGGSADEHKIRGGEPDGDRLQHDDDDRRRTITLRAGKLHDVANEAELALIAADVSFYARGGNVVRPIIEDVPASKGRRTKVARLKSVSVDIMRDNLSRVVRFEKYDGRTEKMVAADPPYDVAKTLLERDGDWNFRPLKGIITSPTLRRDGSILALPGYDTSAALLLVDPPPMPAIPDHPTREDALAAVKQLDKLLCDFPFANAPSHSVALSGLITPVARGAIQVAPLHAFDAPEAGSGKSYLVDLASTIATGENAPVLAAGRNEEETEKRLAAELMTGQPIISIDNLNGGLAGDFLCQAIERPIIKPRILGRSETMRIENSVTIFANGNNILLIGDVVRRVIRCTLDANVERPELRKFSSDPLRTVLEDRGSYIAAALTIVRAYLAAGCPNQCPPLASFGDWSRLIRSSLVWLGYVDPVDTMEAARADDPSRSNLHAIVAAWLNVIGPNKPMTAGQIIAKARFAADDPDLILKPAISAVASHPGESEPDAKKLGQWLGRNKGRVVNNTKIFGELDPHTKQQIWWIGPATTK